MPFSKILFVATIARLVSAHSWIEQMSLIGSNGSYTAAYGYPRGYIARTDPGFNGFSDLWLLPPTDSGRTRINGSDLLCHPAQRTANQTSNYPALTVGPGSSFAMKYFENGHVTLPENQQGKPPMAGTVFVYGTTQPKSDEKIVDVLGWTADGSGGDKRGVLLTAQNFDDGRCYQINGGPISTERQKEFPDPIPGQPGTDHEQWCETDVTLPSTLQTGSYTLYWVWDWPTAAGKDPTYPTGKDEIYTTCADIRVDAKEPTGPVTNQLTQQDPQMNAVPSYKNRPVVAKVPAALAPVGSSVGSSAPVATPTAVSSVDAPSPAAASTALTSPASPTSAVAASSAAASQALTLAQFQLAPVSSGSAASTGASSAYPTSIVSSTATAVVPASNMGQVQTLTATLVVVATLAAGQQGVVASGPYEVTFSRTAEPAATLPSSAKFRRG